MEYSPLQLCGWSTRTTETNATVEINAGGKLVKINEERGLLQRLIVISRSRPQLDLKECIGTYHGLYLRQTGVLLAYDKAKILHHLELLVSNEQLVTLTPAMGVAPNNENGQEMEASDISSGRCDRGLSRAK